MCRVFFNDRPVLYVIGHSAAISEGSKNVGELSYFELCIIRIIFQKVPPKAPKTSK